MQQIKGSVLKARLGFVEERFGQDRLAAVLEALPEDDRKELRQILTVKWYPFDLGKRLDRAIVEALGGGDATFFERLGEASAEKNLGTLHKGFLTHGRPHDFLAQAQAIYSLYYQTGRREYERVGEREGLLTTHEAETFSAPDCSTVVGWYRKALEMCGAKGVTVREEECRARGGAVCRYRVSWT